MSITYAGMIGPSLDGVGSPATFTTDTLVTANTNASAKMIIIRGWAIGSLAGGMNVELSSAQPTFTSACFNPVGGTPCYGTVPIYPLSNSNAGDGTPAHPGPGFFFASIVIPLVDVPIGSTFSLTPSGSATVIYAIGELYTGTVQPPGTSFSTTYGATSVTSAGVVLGNVVYEMTNTVSVASDASMALTFQYTDSSTTCCVKCGSINAGFGAGDAAADGTWNCANTDQTWADTFGTIYNNCRECTGYVPIRTRDWQVLLGHASATPGGTYVLVGQASTPNAINQCELGSNPVFPDTRPRLGQRQDVFILRDHAPLTCCPGTPPPFVGLQGEMSFQASTDVILGPGSIPPQLTSGAAMGKIQFERG